MTRLLAGLSLLALLASPAFAASDTWTAEMQMDEGGEVMTAWVDGTAAEGASYPPGIRMLCFESVNLRYDMGVLPDDKYPTPGDEGDFTFTSGETAITLHMQYEDMDGAFAADVEKTAPVIDLLRHGDTLEVSDAAGKYAPLSFTLKGSSAALATLFKSCS